MARPTSLVCDDCQCLQLPTARDRMTTLREKPLRRPPRRSDVASHDLGCHDLGWPDPNDTPSSVRPLRTLGHGRAAQAVLVEATMPDGRKQVCVEKVFAAGWLTRTIYRIAFQSPFAYRSNREAILTCFYRRRVAAAILEACESGVRVARPLYVRFDRSTRAWVLAAEWINGRGIRPAQADARRIRRWFEQRGKPRKRKPSEKGRNDLRDPSRPEVDELVDSMHGLEKLFAECGLIGSGWQVAPRALVSTANLLREADHYTIIDLESGIPAVLVPKYLVAGAQRGELPPFDDLDSDKLREWMEEHHHLLLRRLGPERLARLHEDTQELIEHSVRWKSSELALGRRPWRLLRRNGLADYQQECIRRWEQDETIDSATAQSLSANRTRARWIWYAGLLPGFVGRAASRVIGNRGYRNRLLRCLRDRDYRQEQLQRVLVDAQQRWVELDRIPSETKLTITTYPLHRLLTVTPATFHRTLSDRRYRAERFKQAMLLLLNPQYQANFGQARVEASIDSWQRDRRLSDHEAERLRGQLSGREVRAYVRGLGAHLALKILTPVVAPIKYGGLAAFLASGNLWFLIPMLVMPLARTVVTLASWWSTRGDKIPHTEALLAGLLPMVGSIAFPLQMFAARSELATFLIRDAAAKLGRRVPIYGGPNSRTEIAMIRSTDLLIELLEATSALARKLVPDRPRVSTVDAPSLTFLKRDRQLGVLDEFTPERLRLESRGMHRRPNPPENRSGGNQAVGNQAGGTKAA